jgi:hypothetical protein
MFETTGRFHHESAQVMRFEQVTEFEQGRRIRYSRLPQVHPAELPEQGNIVQRLFAGFVRQIEPVRQEIHAQHPL